MLACVMLLSAAVMPALAQQIKDADTIRKELGIGAADRTRGVGLVPSRGATATLDVLFTPGSSNLTSLGRAQLDQLGEALKPDSHRFRIEGHTDTTGPAQANLVLSQRRAEAVVTYLVTRHGIDRGRLEAVGMGEQGLAIPTADQVAEPRNRRVAVVKL
jgi:outer membrane protein OmpA-like peptidoglycan-associated protein